MLGPDRFNFETPNVIDPGEMPPSRPSRHASNDYAKDLSKNQNGAGTGSWGTTSRNTSRNIDEPFNYNASDLHERNSRNYKPQLSQGIKLSDYRIDDYKDDVEDGDVFVAVQDRDDEDDVEFGRSSQLPSSDQARLFAAAMLTESDRRQKDKDLETTTGSCPLLCTSNKGQRERQRRLWQIMIGFALFALAAAFVLAVVLGALQVRNNANENDMSPRMTATVDLLSGNGITKEVELTTPGTPQNRAALWIANEDALQLDIPRAISDILVPLVDRTSPYPFVQRYALAVFYYSTKGDEAWTNSLQFVSDQHECSWFQTMPDDMGEIYALGVTCDQELRVRNLLIPFNNCQGTIPNEIRHLEFLDFLSLKHNQLTGSIPPSLRQLKDLDYLDLKNNQLTGTIPRFLGELQQLQVLGLSNNQLSGSLPESLGTLQQLKTLALDDNFLSGGLDPVGKLTNLEFFYAENNVFEGQVNETFFHDFQRLIELDLSNNHLESSSSIPAHIFSLYNLQILDLSENNLQGTLPEAIPPNSVLKYFSLRLNQVLGTIPESISNLRRLQHLDLEANTMKGQLPASLGEMTDLTYLFLGRNPWVAGTIPEEWQSLTKLRELSLDNAKRTGEIPSWLTTEMNHLKLLDLRRNDLTGNIPDGIFLKQLIYLLLSDNKLTGSIPENLGRMAELSIVALHQNGLIGDVNSLCKSSVYDLDLLTTDCGTVSCPCCDSCCSSDQCYEKVVWDSLEHATGSWEEHFQRTDYSFNPHILNSAKYAKTLKVEGDV